MAEIAAGFALFMFGIAALTATAVGALFLSNEYRRYKLDEAIIIAISEGNYRNAGKRVHNKRLRAVRDNKAHDDKARD